VEARELWPSVRTSASGWGAAGGCADLQGHAAPPWAAGARVGPCSRMARSGSAAAAPVAALPAGQISEATRLCWSAPTASSGRLVARRGLGRGLGLATAQPFQVDSRKIPACLKAGHAAWARRLAARACRT